jgi:hypothetical protein
MRSAAPSAFVVLLFRHAWIPFILVTCFHAFTWRRNSRKFVAEKPELGPSYDQLIRGLLIYGNIPWAIMGAGILIGGVPSTFHYFNPRNGPWVAAFYVSVVALWILTVRWIYFLDGAEQLVACPGLLQSPLPITPTLIKVWVGLSIAFGVAGLSVMLTQNIQTPPFLSGAAIESTSRRADQPARKFGARRA